MPVYILDAKQVAENKSNEIVWIVILLVIALIAIGMYVKIKKS